MIVIGAGDGQPKRWVIAGIVLIFVAATAWNVSARIHTAHQTTASLDSIIQVFESNCRHQRALTSQYRVRAKDEVILTRVALLQTHSAIAFFEGKPGTARAVGEFRSTIPKLKHILKTIHILPLPHCAKLGEELRADLP